MSDEEKAAVVVSEKIGGVMESIKGLSVMELVELKDALEDAFGVTAAAPAMMMPGMMAGGGGEPEAEKDSFDVVLKEIGEKKIQVIKAVRGVTSLGLKEAKDVVEKAKYLLAQGLCRAAGSGEHEVREGQLFDYPTPSCWMEATRHQHHIETW